ncbi:MAG TPA: hypothetical protein VFB06_29545 [Streptosporangiaceae bacterium]|nr:hypothetical protein [Streptosporangiaceae bacterium]
MQLLEARAAAYDAWEAARGTPGEYAALCETSKADNALAEYEARLERLRELRAEVRRRKTEPPGHPGESP